MSRIVPIVACSIILFVFIVLHKDMSKDRLSVPVGNITSGDVQLSSEETSGKEQKRKAAESMAAGREINQVQRSEHERKPIYSVSSTPTLSEEDTSSVPSHPYYSWQAADMLDVAQTQSILAPYMMNLRLRAARQGIPPHLVARLLSEISTVVWKAQLAGVPPAEAVGTARFIGENALSSSLKVQKRPSSDGGIEMTPAGGGARRTGTARVRVVSRMQVSRQLLRQQAIQRMRHVHK
jgi:hypothetical protein